MNSQGAFSTHEPVSRRRFVQGAALSAAALAPCAIAHGGSPTEGARSLSHQPIPLDEPRALADLETPALLLDLDAFERNLARMAQHAKDKGFGLRPHGKTHKSPIIARRQLEHGAIGVCAAKVSEAEVFVDAGIEDVLITSPVTTREKISRVVELAKRAPGLQMVVDHPQSAAQLAGAAETAGVTVRVLVDLDTGTRRTGIALGQKALDLVEQVQKSPHLRFDGLQAYAGHVMHVSGHAERRQRSHESLSRCLETKQLIEKAGHPVGVFTGGGTGTFDIDCDLDGVTDLQVGSYIFMDVQYRAIGDADDDIFDVFEPSLFVLATAISQPVSELITIDAGGKSFAYEPEAKPQFRDLEGLVYHYGGDEHGIVQFLGEDRPLKLGQKAQLLVSHCDPTVNLYDVYHPFRDGVVSELWPVAARGRSQ